MGSKLARIWAKENIMPLGANKVGLFGVAGAAGGTLELEILVVGGGGSGGGGDRPASGAGGAGGVLHASVYPAAKGQEYGTTVGAGGAGGSYVTNNGDNSVFDTGTVTGTLTALGGGYGAIPSGYPNVGNDGGSGGGNVQNNSETPGQGIQAAPSIAGVTVTAYGNNGTIGVYPGGSGTGGGGGGGGANANAGEASSGTGGAGGAGKLFSNFVAWGTTSGNAASGGADGGYFAGGGGGGGASTGGAGGVGGGKAGGAGAPGTTGLANTGGGGGGGSGSDGNTKVGGDGGTGVLLIRYAGSPAATGGTRTESGGYTYHAYTSTGNSTFTTD